MAVGGAYGSGWSMWEWVDHLGVVEHVGSERGGGDSWDWR